jgi:hypothetical protein
MSVPSWEDAYDALESATPTPEEKSPVGFPKKYSLEQLIFGAPGSETEAAQKQAAGYGLKKLISGLTSPLQLPHLVESLGGGAALRALPQFGGTASPRIMEALGGEPGQAFPSGETFEKGFEKLSGQEFPEPENPLGQLAGKGLEFFGSMMSTGGLLKAGPRMGALPRNLLSIFVPAGVATISEKADLPPWAQGAATLATSFLVHRFTGANLSDMKRGLYDKADQMSSGARIDVPHVENLANKLQTSLEKGLQAPAESAVLASTKKLLNKIQSGWMGIDELTASKRSLGSLTRAAELKEDPGARKLLKSLQFEIDRSLGQYGKTNPQWNKVYRQANSLTKGMATTRKIFDFIIKNFAKTIGGEIFLKMFMPAAVKTSLYSAPAAQSAAFIWSLARNPGYRKAYWDVLKGAAKGDMRATAASLIKFENEAKKSGLPQPTEKNSEEAAPSWEDAFDSLQR